MLSQHKGEEVRTMADTARVAPLHERVYHTTSEKLWSQVRALHAQWMVEEPGLRLRDTVGRLLGYGLEHAREARGQEGGEDDTLRE